MKDRYWQIIKDYGTPAYVFDSNILLDRIKYLKSFFAGINMVYAVKANTFIIKEIDKVIDRYEICSPGEYEICKKLNIASSKMVISGVYKDRNSIQEMISTSDILKYTVESLSQWELLNELALKEQKHIHVLLRLTSGNQFGMNEDELKDIIRNNHDEFVMIDGIEYFSGTQKHSLKRIEKEITYLVDLIDDIKTNLHFVVKELEYGPGLPVFYFQDDDFDEQSFLTELSIILNKVQDVEVSLEIGRSIAASCGSYLTSIVDLKTNKNGNFALVDGGIHHLVYYGGTMAMRIPHFEVLRQQETDENVVYNLYGSLCTINDVLLKNISTAKLSIGDVFIFKNVGAYSITEGISLFLSRDLPKVLIIDENNNIKLVRDIIKTSNINFPKYESEEL